MKTVVIHQARDIRIENRPVTAPADDEVQIRVAIGGICGSDLHYYNHGGFGSVRLREPMILGHEIAGTIVSVGSEVEMLAPGDFVAVSPSRPCFACDYCRKAMYNHCHDMRFYGSAMPFPHIQGAFRETINVNHHQCVPADGLSTAEAAMTEPLSVALHAVQRAGSVLGKRILVTGSGPIGALVIIAARRAGAAEIIVTDLADNALKHALSSGADQAINIGTDASALDHCRLNKGYFDIQFECSGAEAAVCSGISMVKPRGIIVQLGLSGDMTLPVASITARELQLRGSFRFHEEFATAVELMRRKLVDVTPLITHSFPLAESTTAFEIAGDRNVAMKTQLVFD